MDLHLFMAQRNESYDGEYAPEVLVGWDSITVLENPRGWKKACKDALDARGGISFDTPTLTGTIKG